MAELCVITLKCLNSICKMTRNNREIIQSGKKAGVGDLINVTSIMAWTSRENER